MRRFAQARSLTKSGELDTRSTNVFRGKMVCASNQRSNGDISNALSQGFHLIRFRRLLGSFSVPVQHKNESSCDQSNFRPLYML